jgi:UDP-3-O-[3-hydroxymyristoyl] glucosamine N-acyltransferase
MNNIPDGEKWIWTPAQPDRQAKRQMIALQQLPELIRRVKALEKQLGLKPEPAPSPEPARPE